MKALLFLIFIPLFYYGQIKVTLEINGNIPSKSIPDYNDNLKTWNLVETESRAIISKLRSQGYLLSSLDSLLKDTVVSTARMFISTGKKYFWSKLSKGNLDDNVLGAIGMPETNFESIVFKPKQVSDLLSKILNYYENNGYPFAELRLDSVEIIDEKISASIVLSKNKKVVIDSVILFGNLKVSKNFLKRYLGVYDNQLYNESAINKISDRLRMLPFVTETKPVTVKLTDRTNRLVLFVNKRNASQFDGIVGLLPSTSGKSIFTGDVKIKLINSIFKSAETLELNWRRLQTETQDLKTRFIIPYVFNTPFGAEHGFKLYKRDSTFMDLNNVISLNYFFSGLNYFKFIYKQRSGRILSKSIYISPTNLIEFSDITASSYGLGFFYENLDYKLNPRKGISMSFNGTAGIRVINKNPNINEEYYGNFKLRSSQYQLESEFSFYIPVRKKSTVKSVLQCASLNGNQIFRNELFRIGGLKTLRGFNEESIFSSTYIIGTVEYRFLFEQNSNLFLFGDFCWYEKNETVGYLKDMPIGLGTGINFETKAGIFSLTYALGNQLNNGFDIRSGKIHFGVVNNF
jgi:hypothetical protein